MAEKETIAILNEDKRTFYFEQIEDSRTFKKKSEHSFLLQKQNHRLFQSIRRLDRFLMMNLETILYSFVYYKKIYTNLTLKKQCKEKLKKDENVKKKFKS